MILYLIRHGEAEPQSKSINDASRKLTREGVEILKTSVRLWKNLIDSIDIIISSPLIRAVQTAEIIRNEFKVEGKIIPDNSLLNGGDIKDLLSLAESLEKNNIAMVGHQPDLSEHISKLISQQGINLHLSPAAIVKISFVKNSGMEKGVLEFLIPPVQAV